MQALEEHERTLRMERLKELEEEAMIEEEKAFQKAGPCGYSAFLLGFL